MSEANLGKALRAIETLRQWPSSQQFLSLELYRLLARGEPVARERVAESLGLPTREVASMLEDRNLQGQVLYDGFRRITGFRGLSLVPTRHRITLDGRTLYAWCAMDTLFLAEVLGQRIGVESPCPGSNTIVRLSLGPSGAEFVEPADPVVSFRCCEGGLERASPADLIASFCHYVFFHRSAEVGKLWTVRHPGTFLLTLPEALEWGRRFNAAQLGDALTSMASA